MDAKVLDSWAILAWMRGEASAPRVRALLESAAEGKLILHCSAINAGEVFCQLVRLGRHAEADRFWSDLMRRDVPLRLEGATIPRVKAAASIKAAYPPAYADAFAVSLAREFGCPLVTGDSEIRAPANEGIVTVEWLKAFP